MRRDDAPEEVRARLREAAGAHRPDRERMLVRVERGMAGPGRPVRRAARPREPGWIRVAGATAAVAGVLAAAGYTAASAVRDAPAPPQRQVAVSPTTAAAPPSTPPPEAPDAARPPAGSGGGPLGADGAVNPHSNEFWAQSDVTLRAGERLTALTVRLRVAQTGGVSSTGAWRSLPEQDFGLTVGERGGFLVYTWTLRKGRTVPPGEWVFAGQYDHARGGRDARKDTYTATAATAGAERFSVDGGFTPGDADDTAAGR
ncbi:hypothetical protein ACIF80_08775 [Streptomyces sp. NPDC085927]|uniref:hypothetical protein n=1 Tax=Streptomyces sp. NPDC085927 TaxID=3365738 RepID=UPI0037D735C5